MRPARGEDLLMAGLDERGDRGTVVELVVPLAE
jgi:hypothetical protein